MRAHLLAGALFVIATATARAEPVDEIKALVTTWADAFSASDVDAIVATYAPDALFVGTGSKAIVTDQAGIRAYFEDALLNNRPRGAKLDSSSIRMLSDTAAVVTGLDTVTGVRGGQAYSVRGRVTFVVSKQGERWQIVHFHRSAMPN